MTADHLRPLLDVSADSLALGEDDVGDVHQVAQGEGGEQGDPLMPLLFGNTLVLNYNVMRKLGHRLARRHFVTNV